MCRSLNKSRKFSKPRSQYDRAVVGSAVVMHPGSFSAKPESSTASGCSPLSMCVDSKERLRRHMLLVRPRYEAVIAAG